MLCRLNYYLDSFKEIYTRRQGEYRKDRGEEWGGEERRKKEIERWGKGILSSEYWHTPLLIETAEKIVILEQETIPREVTELG